MGVTATVVLVPRVTVPGRLLPLGKTAGVRIVAHDQSSGIAAPVTSALVDDQGGYALSLHPGRQYELVAEPPPGQFALARTVLDIKNSPVSRGAPALDYTVAAGFPFQGIVVGEGAGTAMAGALVEVFCVGGSPSCLDPETAIAEAVTDYGGAFTVALPTPSH